MTCSHLHCLSDADARAWDGARWRPLCLDHLPGAARLGYPIADLDGPDTPPRPRAVEAPPATPEPCRPPSPPAPVARLHAAARACPGLLLPLVPGRCRCCEQAADPRRRGLCARHYHAGRHGGWIDEVAAPRRVTGPPSRYAAGAPCVRGCKRPGSSRHRGMCTACYTRERRAKVAA